MFRLAGKGFAAVKKRGVRGTAQSCRSREQRDAWIIRFPVSRHCTIEIYVGGHTWAQSFAAERVWTEVNREGFERARNLPAERPPIVCTPPLYGLFELIVSWVYFCFQIQSYVPLLAVRRLVELTRNPVFVIKPCNASSDHNQDSCTHLTYGYSILPLQKFYSRFTRPENWS